MRKLPSIMAALLLLLGGNAAFAQDAELYDRVPDPNAAYLRVLMPSERSAVIAGKAIEEMDSGLSPYVLVEPGRTQVASGDISGTVDTEAGGFFTMTPDASGNMILFKDLVADDPSKCGLYFYNLTDLPSIDVFVPLARTNALEGVAAFASKAVLLKAPLKIDIELRSAGSVVAKLPALELRRKAGISVVIAGKAGNYSTFAIDNSLLLVGPSE